MNKPYIYDSNKNSELQDKSQAIVILPDIFGLTEYAKATVEDFRTQLSRPTYMLDYFYSATNQPTDLDPTNDNQMNQAVGLMNDFTGDQFLKAFKQVVGDIKQAQASLQSITVVGFCFAGRLAYLTSAVKEVTRIVSFYGAGANKPDFVEGKSPVEFLIAQKSNAKVLSFYGTKDETIPEADRKQTNDLLTKAGVSYEFKEYPTGHAYFQPGRPKYDEAAATSSWQDLKQFLAN